ncbi:MAG: polyprenyl synthetase family protein [Aestuariivirga sp.]
MAAIEKALEENAARCEAVLAGLLSGLPKGRLRDAMEYAVLGGGKRLRPFLVRESASLFDVPEAQALRVGAALECIHCYSLVHDDLPAMDNDDLRRGKPTTHRAFDEATAILAGDALQSLAFAILSDPGTHPDPAIRSELVLKLAHAAGAEGMAGGQMLDIEAETSGYSDVSKIIVLQALKTGALFRFACEAGAILGRGDPAQLTRYADKIGLAFQIADDILDITSAPEALGKATQKDAAQGKATLAGLLGLDTARARAQELAGEAAEAVSVYGEKAETLKALAGFIVSRER